VRRSGETPYDTDSERAVETLPLGPLSLSTNAGLILAGSTTGFKVCVKLNTGNEAGSNAVTISRPPALETGQNGHLLADEGQWR